MCFLRLLSLFLFFSFSIFEDETSSMHVFFNIDQYLCKKLWYWHYYFNFWFNVHHPLRVVRFNNCHIDWLWMRMLIVSCYYYQSIVALSLYCFDYLDFMCRLTIHVDVFHESKRILPSLNGMLSILGVIVAVIVVSSHDTGLDILTYYPFLSANALHRTYMLFISHLVHEWMQYFRVLTAC